MNSILHIPDLIYLNLHLKDKLTINATDGYDFIIYTNPTIDYDLYIAFMATGLWDITGKIYDGEFSNTVSVQTITDQILLQALVDIKYPDAITYLRNRKINGLL